MILIDSRPIRQAIKPSFAAWSTFVVCYNVTLFNVFGDLQIYEMKWKKEDDKESKEERGKSLLRNIEREGY